MEQIHNTPPSPCYDPKTRTDCPNRHGGCAKTCRKWAEYVKARSEVYAKRKATFDANDVIFNQIREKESKRLKKEMRHRRFKKG